MECLDRAATVLLKSQHVLWRLSVPTHPLTPLLQMVPHRRRFITLQDKFGEFGRLPLQDVASKTNEVAGDGTTPATYPGPAISPRNPRMPKFRRITHGFEESNKLLSKRGG